MCISRGSECLETRWGTQQLNKRPRLVDIKLILRAQRSWRGNSFYTSTENNQAEEKEEEKEKEEKEKEEKEEEEEKKETPEGRRSCLCESIYFCVIIQPFLYFTQTLYLDDPHYVPIKHKRKKGGLFKNSSENLHIVFQEENNNKKGEELKYIIIF